MPTQREYLDEFHQRSLTALLLVREDHLSIVAPELHAALNDLAQLVASYQQRTPVPSIAARQPRRVHVEPLQPEEVLGATPAQFAAQVRQAARPQQQPPA